MVIDFYNRNGGGGGGTADYATLAGESDKSKLLEGASAPPQSANTGDVVAIAPNPTRGTKALRTLGVYQYDGTNWNKIEGESSSAYKIELSSVDPQYYTQQDRDNLIAFYAAFTADTSIADSAYIYAVDGIYRCVRYIAIPNSPIFAFEGTYNDNIVDIWLHFSDGRFSYGSLQNAVPTPPTPEFTSLKPASDFPEDPVEGEVIALTYKEGNSISFDRGKVEFPEGESNKAQILRISIDNDYLEVDSFHYTGETYVLKFSNANFVEYLEGDGEVELFSENDLYAWAIEENDGVITISYSETSSGDLQPLRSYNIETNECGAAINNSVEIGYGIYQFVDGGWERIDNKFLTPHTNVDLSKVPQDVNWGGAIYSVWNEAEDVNYQDASSVWEETGEYTINFDHPVQAIRAHIKTNGHFDFGFNDADWHDGFAFDIVADGNNGYVFSAQSYDSSRWEVSEQDVEFIAPDWMAKTDGKTLYLNIHEYNGDYYLYIYTEDVELIWITDVAQNTIDGEIQEGEVIPAHGDIYKVFQAVYDEEQDKLVPAELAKTADLPAENRLVPEGGSFNDYLRKGGDGPEWVSIRQVPFTDMQKDYTGAVLMSKSIYADEYGWDFIRTDMLKPKSSLPVQGEDGAVYALSSSGYGIVQAQSAHTGQGWFNYNGKSVPSGFTQIRVPYNDTAESNLVHFKTDPNGEGDCNIYWHPEDSSNRRWDGLPNDPAQNDGEFSTTDAWGNTMVGTKVGDYIVVTFGAAVVDGGDPNDPLRADNHTEIYTTDSITDYANAVMSKDIARMVKCTQAEYDALVSGGTVDNSTFYVIISPNS